MRKSRGITTYSGIHRHLVLTKGKASERLCACGSPAHEWAYMHDDPCPDERVDAAHGGIRFSLDPDKYRAMCRRCHRIYDKEHITECPKGHKYSADNTIDDAGKRKCKTCVYARNRARPRTAQQKARAIELQRLRRAAARAVLVRLQEQP